MSEWVEKARALIAGGMSVNLVCRELGKSEHAVRMNLNINGAADRYKAAKEARGKRVVSAKRSATSAPTSEVELLKTITLPKLNLKPIEIDEVPSLKFAPRVRAQAEPPRVAQIREIHQRMIRQGKIEGRDLLSEWRA